jgi:hypothetical protein
MAWNWIEDRIKDFGKTETEPGIEPKTAGGTRAKIWIQP